ncbi:MAG: sulfate permease [Planctomycetes bacterium]|nr:sulfate permease [Planctomycetota bacterium]
MNLWRHIPLLGHLRGYGRADAAGDGVASLVVTLMLIPQSLAYALLAGLPVQYGLYASILPLAVYGLLGSSRTLSVGPVAVLALMTASALQPLAATGSPEYVSLAMLLAGLVGVISLGLGLLRAGFVASLLSHPVVAGFITGSSLVIILSQLKHILGVRVAEAHYPWQTAVNLVIALPQTHLWTLLAGVIALALLVLARAPLRKLLQRVGLRESAALLASRLAPALIVALSMLLVGVLGLDTHLGLRVVGDFPGGLPALSLPALSWGAVTSLLPAALAIVLVGYVESVSVGRTLGARKGQRIDPNQELVALGAANLAGAVSGGFPVSGGFARSIVNHDAGARTGLASLLAAGLIALVALMATGWFAFLPQVVLAATVIVAVSTLIDLKELRRLWKFRRGEGALMALTMIAVLALGVEMGVAAGVVLSLAAFLARASRPHMAVVGRVPGTEHFRNVKRHDVQTWPNLLLVRVDENLFFANAQFVEDHLEQALAAQPGAAHVVLIASGVNGIDASGLHALGELKRRLASRNVTLHLAEVKGPVHDALQRAGFEKDLAPGQVFLTTHQAVLALQGQNSHCASAQAA